MAALTLLQTNKDAEKITENEKEAKAIEEGQAIIKKSMKIIIFYFI